MFYIVLSSLPTVHSQIDVLWKDGVINTNIFNVPFTTCGNSLFLLWVFVTVAVVRYCCGHLLLLNKPSHTTRPKHLHSHHPCRGQPPPPFSVSLAHAQIPDGVPILSAVSIPSQWCPPTVQRLLHSARFTRCHRSSVRHLHYCCFIWLLFCLFLLFFLPQHAYAIPGTKHGLLVGEKASDIHQQKACVNSIIKNLD